MHLLRSASKIGKIHCYEKKDGVQIRKHLRCDMNNVAYDNFQRLYSCIFLISLSKNTEATLSSTFVSLGHLFANHAA